MGCLAEAWGHGLTIRVTSVLSMHWSNKHGCDKPCRAASHYRHLRRRQSSC